MSKYTFSIERFFGFGLLVEWQEKQNSQHENPFFEHEKDDDELLVWIGRLHFIVSKE